MAVIVTGMLQDATVLAAWAIDPISHHCYVPVTWIYLIFKFSVDFHCKGTLVHLMHTTLSIPSLYSFFPALTFYHPWFFVTACPVSPNSHKSGANVWKYLFFVSYASRLTNVRIQSYRTPRISYCPALPSLTIRWGVEAIFCYVFACTWVIVCASAHICSYIDWTIAATT